MGIRDWFGGRSGSPHPTPDPDSVWLSGEARLAGVAAKVEAHSAQGLVLVLAHFPRTRDAIEAALSDRVELELAGSSGDVASWLAAPGTKVVGLALVEQLPEGAPSIVGRTTDPISILVVERHPLRAQDDRVEKLARTLPYPSRVQFHLALDDTLLERYVPEQIKVLLERLGMSPEEEVSHPAVSQAVERAQEKMARAESAPAVDAQSAEDWLEAIEPS